MKFRPNIFAILFLAVLTLPMVLVAYGMMYLTDPLSRERYYGTWASPDGSRVVYVYQKIGKPSNIPNRDVYIRSNPEKFYSRSHRLLTIDDDPFIDIQWIGNNKITVWWGRIGLTPSALKVDRRAAESAGLTIDTRFVEDHEVKWKAEPSSPFRNVTIGAFVRSTPAPVGSITQVSGLSYFSKTINPWTVIPVYMVAGDHDVQIVWESSSSVLIKCPSCSDDSTLLKLAEFSDIKITYVGAN